MQEIKNELIRMGFRKVEVRDSEVKVYLPEKGRKWYIQTVGAVIDNWAKEHGYMYFPKVVDGVFIAELQKI